MYGSGVYGSGVYGLTIPDNPSARRTVAIPGHARASTIPARLHSGAAVISSARTTTPTHARITTPTARRIEEVP